MSVNSIILTEIVARLNKLTFVTIKVFLFVIGTILSEMK